jgi:hypothetical protein
MAHQVDMHGDGDIDELVQEARITIWRIWQETMWTRTAAAKPTGYYVKAAKSRMRAICYRKVSTFGAEGRQGYMDAANHSEVRLDDENTIDPTAEEIPFELLDRIPACLIG